MFRALCTLLLAASSLAYHVTRREFVPLIINGDDADVGEWPHQCSFQDDTGFHFCGSVYLGGDWVLTAAHCAVGNSPSSVRVVCGILNRSDATDADTYEVVDLIVHPDYDSFTLENDHALIQLAEVPSGDNIASIFVDDVGGDNWVGSDCYITGWGDNENGVNPDTLQEAAVLALSQADCEDAYSQTPYDVFEDMVCVGHDNDVYVGGCYGDSGGPFVCRKTPDEPYTLVGVASWAYPPCGADEYPTVYSRSAFFRDWISENCGGCI